MFAIIEFSDHIYDVCPTVNIRKIDKGTCAVKYKTGRYLAKLLGINGNVKFNFYIFLYYNRLCNLL